MNLLESGRTRTTQLRRAIWDTFFSCHIFHQKISHTHREVEFKYKVGEGYDKKEVGEGYDFHNTSLVFLNIFQYMFCF